MLLLGGCTTLALIFKFLIAEKFASFYSFDWCKGDVNCLGNSAVYRFSAAMSAYFGITAVWAKFSPSFHLEQWHWKLFSAAGLVVGMFLIPAQTMAGYAWFARVASVAFLVLQIVILIDLAYNIHEYIVDKKMNAYGGGSSAWWPVLYLTMGFGFCAASIAGLSVLYALWPACALNLFFQTLTLIVGTVLVLLSILNVVGRGLLVPSVIFAYATLLCWQAVSNNPRESCNSFAQSTGTVSPGQLVLSLLVTSASLLYATYSAASSAPDLFRGAKTEENNKADAEIEAGRQQQQQPEGEEKAHKASFYSFFYVCCFLGSVYMAMLLTNWGTSDGSSNAANLEMSDLSMWVKIAAQWLTFLLYTWTLVAPLIFPDRDFSRAVSGPA